MGRARCKIGRIVHKSSFRRNIDLPLFACQPQSPRAKQTGMSVGSSATSRPFSISTVPTKRPIAQFDRLSIKSHCLQTEPDPNLTLQSETNSGRLPIATWPFLRLVGRVYLVLWMTAVGGLVLANFAGLLGMFFAEENKAELVRPWMHTGWTIGAVLAFIGAVTGKLKMQWSQQESSHRRSPRKSARRLRDESACNEDADEFPIADGTAEGVPSLTADENELADASEPAGENEQTAENEQTDARRKSPDAQPKKKSSVIGAAAFFGMLGGLGGTIAGGSLLVFFFSLAYSPLAPSWRKSVSVEDVSTDPSGNQKAMVSRDDIAWKIVLVPAGIGLTIGAIVGGVGAAAGKVTNG